MVIGPQIWRVEDIKRAEIWAIDNIKMDLQGIGK
jgi:hypothetical protein